MQNQININKLSVIIVDDELYGRENLKKIIENYCHELTVLVCANSVLEAKKMVDEYKPDVVFLDINMPILDGFDFLGEYDDREFMVVIVSAHEEFGINAVKSGVEDYLLKPINIKELKQTVKKLLLIKNKKIKNEILQSNDKLVLPASHGFEILFIDDIIILKAEGCYTKVVLINGKNKIVSRTLKDFEETLPANQFFRIHKSNMINLKYIKDYSNIGGGIVTMSDGSKIEISRRKAPEFIQKIKETLSAV
jgi:two-component system LytT family response regulator